MSTTTAPTSVVAPTSLLRLEVVRWIRTHRLLGLSALFALIGLCMPIATANLAWILERSAETRAMVASLPDPTPAAGIAAYLGQVGQLGLVVLIAAVAGPLCPYASRSAALYHWSLTRGVQRGRMRASAASPARVTMPASVALLLPRFAVSAGAVVLVYLLGLAGAWYETTVLIGAPDAGAMLAGAALSCLYLIWVCSVVAVVGARADGQVATAGLSVLVVLVVGFCEHLPAIGTAMPTRLLSAPAQMLTGGGFVDHLPAAGTALALTLGLLAAAAIVTDRKEL